MPRHPSIRVLPPPIAHGLSALTFTAIALAPGVIAQTPPKPADTPGTAFELPKPGGPFAVGTTSFSVIDESRAETFSESAEKRQVQVLAWYPAADDAQGGHAPYLRAGMQEARAFATLMRQPEIAFDYLAGVKTHSVVDAPPRTGAPLPVLLFSHGYIAHPSSYTALLEDLASHGYVVLSVVHPYEAMAAALADGRVVTILDAQKQMRKGIRDVLGEWAKEDETMALVTKAGDEAEQMRLMRGYLAAVPITTAALTRWVDDTALVLNRLSTMPAGSAARIAARVDLARLGAFGHSMGGVTAAQFCAQDRRCKAGLNLDGIPQYGAMVDTPMNRPFLMVYSAREGRRGASDVIYSRSARPYVRVDVDATLHNDFTDMVLWGGPLSGRPIFGSMTALHAIAVTRQIVREYFDQELLGRRSPLLSGAAPVPGVRVH
jgi:pimeloyl-ACP methyl ester carboxylesterase